MRKNIRLKGISKSYVVLEVLAFILGLILLVNNQSNNYHQNSSYSTNTSGTNLSLLENNSSNDTYLVTRVIDGDTIEIEGGKKVRYLGIDTPETVDPRKPVQCFGIEASNENKKLVLGKRVKLEKDISETDKYGRLLRYVYVDDIFVNDYLVRNGYAYAVTFPPDVKYQQQFLEAQKEARENKRGLWSACQSTNN
jgi:micrococcal nuclease